MIYISDKAGTPKIHQTNEVCPEMFRKQNDTSHCFRSGSEHPQVLWKQVQILEEKTR